MALVEREILGNQQRLVHELQLGQGRRNVGKQLGVVIDWRIALGKVEVVRAARCGAGLVQHAAHALARTVKHVIRKHAQAASDMRLPRNRIADGAGLQQAELANAGLVGTQLVHQFALGNQKLGCCQRRVVRFLDWNAVSLGDMDACPVNVHVRFTRARQQRTRTAHQRVRRQVGPYVEPEDTVCPVALKHPTLTNCLGATGRLLGRLEHKEHVALDGTRLLTNRAIDKGRRRKRHGHVSIVSASVHLSGMCRGKGRARRLRDGKRVHIGANRRGMRGARASVEEGADAARAGMGHLAGKRGEHALDIGDGLRKIEVELRNAMQVATIATEFLEPGHKGSFHGAYPFTQYCDAEL